MRTHTIVTTRGFTCDGMTITEGCYGNVVQDLTDGFTYGEARGICTLCEDVAYHCESCQAITCVNAMCDDTCGPCCDELDNATYDGADARPLHVNDQGALYHDGPIRPLDGHDPRVTVGECPAC
jgi:hypothetical protein